MNEIWFGFKIGIGLILACAFVAAIIALVKREYERRKSVLYQLRKVRRLIDKAQALRLSAKEKQVMGLKDKLQSAKTDEEKKRLQRILDEQTLLLKNMLENKVRDKLPNVPETKEEWHEAMRRKLGDAAWAKEKPRFDRDWKQIKELL